MEDRRRDTGTLASSETSGGSLALDPATRRRAGALKRKANAVTSSNSSSTSSKRKAMLASMSPVHNGPLTRARQAPSNVASSAPTGVKHELVNTAAGADGENPKEEEELNKIRQWEALEAKIEAEFETIRSRHNNAHVVPNHCGWFSWQKVHPLEERSLPSFFNEKSDSRTPEVYMEIRNWIMKKFHSNPNTPIELKDLAELEAGDSDAKQEVMEFLDYWGLINFHPFPSSDSGSAAFDEDRVEDKDSPLNSLYRFQEVEACPAPVHKPHLAAQAIPSGLFPESIVVDDLLKQEGPSVEYHCNSCSADCSRKRYHCPKQADFDLCTECFTSGKFGSDISSSDFILMEPAETPGVGSGKWTDQENLLLLEALELFKENWNEIAEHVATKTKAQCMLHFLQMPIEDAFLDQIDDKGSSSKTSADSAPKDEKPVLKDTPVSAADKNEASEGETVSSPKEIPQSGHDDERKTSQESSKPEDGSEEANEMKADQTTLKPDADNDVTCKDEAGENIALKALAEAFEDVGYSLMPETSFSFADLGNPVMGLAAFLVRLVESDVATASVRASLKSADSCSSGLWLATRHCFFLEDPPDHMKDSTGSETSDDHHNAQKDEQPEEGSHTQKESSVVSDGRDILNSDKSKEVKDSVSGEKGTNLSDKSSGKEVSVEKDGKMISEENKEALQLAGDEDVEMTDALISAKEPQDLVEKHQEEIQPRKEHTASVAANDKDLNKEDTKEKNVGKGTEDKHNIGKLKRAALAALSAAAVKAKHLAKHEEDQIRQLSISIIEKQLHKLETKMTIFTEMENLTTRVREQLERSRQRLYHERAQIIAARLGVPPSSSKASLPTNRIATNFANAVPRPPMGMAYQRPPIPRPMSTPHSAPPYPPHSLLPTSTMSGSSIPHSGLDNASSG